MSRACPGRAGDTTGNLGAVPTSVGAGWPGSGRRDRQAWAGRQDRHASGKGKQAGEVAQRGDAVGVTGAGCDILERHPAGTWWADSGEPDVAPDSVSTGQEGSPSGRWRRS